MTRTIATLEERWALPRGTVIRDAAGVAWVKRPVSWMATTPIEDDQWIGMPATVLHDPSAPAPAPSVVPEAAVEALSEWGVDESDVAALREAAVEAVAWKLIDCTSDLADRAPSDETRRTANADARAALPLLTAASSASREEVTRAIRSVTDRWDEPLVEVHDVPPIADAILARFVITERNHR